MRVLIVKPGEKPLIAEIESSLEAMQQAVGGYIQAIYPFKDPVALICHEEGKFLGLPLNRGLFHPDTGALYDIVAGTFFLCAAPPDSDGFEGLTEVQLAIYKKRFQSPELFIKLNGHLFCLPVKEESCE